MHASVSNCPHVRSVTNPAFSICVYAHSEFVSDYWRKHRKYEPDIEQQIYSILHKNPKMGFVDIGANIGSHALYAGAMGRKVLAVEPFPRHIHTVSQSVALNGFSKRFTLINNAISNKYSTYTLEHMRVENMGAFRIKEIPKSSVTAEQKNTTFQSILLDDLVDCVKGETVLLKMDLEGYEDKALEHAGKFLKEVDVPYIILEWTFPLVVYTKDTARVEHFLDLIYSYNYKPVKMMTYTPLSRKNWKKWSNDILLRRNN
jgi:FkbM family methyltransferase